MQWHRWMHAPLFDTRYDARLYTEYSRAREIVDNNIDASVAERLATQDLNRIFPHDILELPAFNMLIIGLLRVNPHYAAKIEQLQLANAQQLDVSGITGSTLQPSELPVGEQYIPARFVCSFDVAALGTLYWAVAQPTAELQQRIEQYKQQYFTMPHARPLVIGAIHMRLGFAEDSNFELDHDAMWFWSCAHLYHQLVDRWLVVSDSQEMLERSRHYLGADRVIHIPGQSKHTRFHGVFAPDDYAKLFVDHLMLTEANVAIVSPSQFSRISLARHHYCPHIYPKGPKVNGFKQRNYTWVQWPPDFFGTPCAAEFLDLQPRRQASIVDT
jgi:hypothetical protein